MYRIMILFDALVKLFSLNKSKNTKDSTFPRELFIKQTQFVVKQAFLKAAQLTSKTKGKINITKEEEFTTLFPSPFSRRFFASSLPLNPKLP